MCYMCSFALFRLGWITFTCWGQQLLRDECRTSLCCWCSQWITCPCCDPYLLFCLFGFGRIIKTRVCGLYNGIVHYRTSSEWLLIVRRQLFSAWKGQEFTKEEGRQADKEKETEVCVGINRRSCPVSRIEWDKSWPISVSVFLSFL